MLTKARSQLAFAKAIAMVAVVASALVATALAGADKPTRAVKTSESPTLTVIDGNGDIAAEFHDAKCRKRSGDFKALTPRTDSGWRLFVSIEDFSGFHDYDLVQGAPHNGPWASVIHGEKAYSNLNVPPFPSPGFGQIAFGDHGKLMGVGYHPAYSEGGSDAVTFTGGVKCHFPKRRR